MLDPVFEIGGGSSHQDPEIRGGGGAVSRIKIFRPLGPQFDLKLRGAPSPGSTNDNNNNTLIQSIKCILKVTKVIKIKVKLKL